MLSECMINNLDKMVEDSEKTPPVSSLELQIVRVVGHAYIGHAHLVSMN